MVTLYTLLPNGDDDGRTTTDAMEQKQRTVVTSLFAKNGAKIAATDLMM
ncbi:hypothetical protein OK016_16320 [Vibrio chagasii]|nr:hypothetical protein [Vibrio chagasii]